MRYVTVAERLKGMASKRRVGTFSVLPKRVKFETQAAEEKVVLLLRQHWFTQVGWVLTALVMVLMPLSLEWIPLIDFMPARFQFMSIVIWYLLVIALVYEKFISWFYHVFIVTDERIIDIDFSNLIYKNISSTKIENIEDVTYSVSGVLPSLLNFGMVFIQTAGEVTLFEIFNTPHPSLVTKLINEMILEEEQEKLEGRVR